MPACYIIPQYPSTSTSICPDAIWLVPVSMEGDDRIDIDGDDGSDSESVCLQRRHGRNRRAGALCLFFVVSSITGLWPQWQPRDFAVGAAGDGEYLLGVVLGTWHLLQGDDEDAAHSFMQELARRRTRGDSFGYIAYESASAARASCD